MAEKNCGLFGCKMVRVQIRNFWRFFIQRFDHSFVYHCVRELQNFSSDSIFSWRVEKIFIAWIISALSKTIDNSVELDN